MSGDERLQQVAARLKAEFDDAFTWPHAPQAPAVVDLLVIGVGERGYALELSSVRALHADRKLVPVPSPRADLLGLVGVRGVVAPVYDLALLLGHAAPAAPRWLAHVRAPVPFAVGFEHFERHLRLPRAELSPAREGHSAFAHASARTERGLLPVIDLLMIFESVTRRPAAPERREEPR
jgi:chemotaxis signal transduction protein